MLYAQRQTHLQMQSVMRIGTRRSLWNWRSDLPERVWNAEDGLLEQKADRRLQTATMSWLVRAMHYFVVTEVSGIHEPNPALWLVTRLGKMTSSFPLGLRGVSPKKNFPKAESEAVCIYFIDQASWAKMTGL